MTDVDVVDAEPTQVLERPIDLSTVKKPDLMFFLAGRTPLPTESFAEKCQDASVEPVLGYRFSAEIKIDSVDEIRLTGDARRYVIEGSKPVVKAGQSALEAGEKLAESEEFEAATDQFVQAIADLQSVEDSFDAVHHQSEKISRVLRYAKQQHDDVLKETAKDSINYQVLRGRQHESTGENYTGQDASQAIDAFEDAKDAYSTALTLAAEYNESRLSTGSNRLSPDSLQDRLDSVTQRLQAVTNQEEEIESSETQSQSTFSEGFQGLRAEFPSVGKAILLDLESAGYEQLTDFTNTSTHELSRLETISPAVAKKILAYANTDARTASLSGGSEDRSVSTNQSTGSIEESVSTEQSESESGAETEATSEPSRREKLLDELRRLDDGWRQDIDKLLLYSVSKYDPDAYEEEFGSLENAIAAAGLEEKSEQEPDLENEQEPDLENEQEPDLENAIQETEFGDKPAEDHEEKSEAPTEEDSAGEEESATPTGEDPGSTIREELLDDLRRLDNEWQKNVDQRLVFSLGEYHPDAYEEEFGSLENAIEAAALSQEPDKDGSNEEPTTDSSPTPNLDSEEATTDTGAAREQKAGTIKSSNSGNDAKTANKTSESEMKHETASTSTRESTLPAIDDREFEPNELSELCDLFETFQSIIDESIVLVELEIGMFTDAWHRDIYNYWDGDGPTGARNWAHQQQSRNSISIENYREVYGNGNRVTEFYFTDFKEFDAESRPWFDADSFDIETEDLFIPVAPESGVPLPVIVESKEELQHARDLLDEFPAKPSVDGNVIDQLSSKRLSTETHLDDDKEPKDDEKETTAVDDDTDPINEDGDILDEIMNDFEMDSEF